MSNLNHRVSNMDEYRLPDDVRERFGYHQALPRIQQYLAYRQPARLQIDGFRPAAVAVALLDKGGVTHVILTKRSAALRAHSGQVSFPGGTCDPTDHSAADTALRESQEEIGLAPASLRVLGTLDDEATPSGYIITPVIVTLAAQPHYRPNRDEVAAVFEAPLSAFCDPSRAERRGERRVGSLCYPLRAYRYREYEVTGATAHILETVSQLLMGP